jgi:hypothetical protein
VFRAIRVPPRAGAFLALGLALLAARAMSRWAPRTVGVAGAFALAESLIAPVELPAWTIVADTGKPPAPVYAWLAAQPGEPPVVELPMLDIRAVRERPFAHESAYMVHSTRHWKPLLNGYAGVEPASYVALREAARTFPSAQALAAFRERGARYVIVHRRGYGPNQWARVERDLPALLLAGPRLREVAAFPAEGDTVYELVD